MADSSNDIVMVQAQDSTMEINDVVPAQESVGVATPILEPSPVVEESSSAISEVPVASSDAHPPEQPQPQEQQQQQESDPQSQEPADVTVPSASVPSSSSSSDDAVAAAAASSSSSNGVSAAERQHVDWEMEKLENLLHTETELEPMHIFLLFTTIVASRYAQEQRKYPLLVRKALDFFYEWEATSFSGKPSSMAALLKDMLKTGHPSLSIPSFPITAKHKAAAPSSKSSDENQAFFSPVSEAGGEPMDDSSSTIVPSSHPSSSSGSQQQKGVPSAISPATSTAAMNLFSMADSKASKSGPGVKQRGPGAISAFPLKIVPEDNDDSSIIDLDGNDSTTTSDSEEEERSKSRDLKNKKRKELHKAKVEEGADEEEDEEEEEDDEDEQSSKKQRSSSATQSPAKSSQKKRKGKVSLGSGKKKSDKKKSTKKEEEETELYDVERIMGSRVETPGGRRQFLVKWKDYPHTKNTWEYADSFVDQSMIHAYLKSHKLTATKL